MSEIRSRLKKDVTRRSAKSELALQFHASERAPKSDERVRVRHQSVRFPSHSSVSKTFDTRHNKTPNDSFRKKKTRKKKKILADLLGNRCRRVFVNVPNANMFRNGHYLEVIKASDDCLATVVVTVEEKTVEIKKRKVITNKWLQIEDWAAVYKILERAILRNCRNNGSHRKSRGCERKKSTRQLEVTYTFEHSECASETSSLPTIQVHVSPARKKSTKQEIDDVSKRNKAITYDDATKRTREEKSSDRLKKTFEKPTQTFPKKKKIETAHTIATGQQEDLKRKKSQKYMLSDDLENAPLEEYIPDAPKSSCPDFKYVPSRKSALKNMRLTSNEYTPTLCDSKCVTESVSYVPNSIENLKTAIHEIYEPHATTTIPDGILEEYVPNSKGVKSSIEEYEPDFKSPSKLMKFDDSYVPSRVRQSTPNNSKRISNKLEKFKTQRLEAHRKGTLVKKKMGFFS